MRGAILLLSFCCFGLSGCADTWENLIYGEHTFSEPFEQPYDEIWDIVVEVVERNYEIDKLKKSESKIVTKWEEVYAPIRGHGFRTRIDALVKEEEGMYLVGFRAIRDKNDNISRPLEPEEAEWEYVGREPLLEEKLLQQVRYYLQKDFGPSKKLRQQLEQEEDRRFQEKYRGY